MHILLKFSRPPAHWLGLANLISHSDGLREDITLIVKPDGARFCDAQGNEIHPSSPITAADLEATKSLAGKLRFLAMLHDRFPIPQPPVPAQSRLPRSVPRYHKTGAIQRSIRFGAAASAR